MATGWETATYKNHQKCSFSDITFSRIGESGESNPGCPFCRVMALSDRWSAVTGVPGRDATNAPVDSDAVTVETIC
jgi:hypothetical protein